MSDMTIGRPAFVVDGVSVKMQGQQKESVHVSCAHVRLRIGRQEKKAEIRQILTLR